MKKNGLWIMAVLLLTNCGQKTNAQDAEKAIRHYYDEVSLADGGGTYSIDSVIIIWQHKQPDGIWLVKARITGSFENGSLPENEGPEAFDSENEYTLEQENKLWKVVSIK